MSVKFIAKEELQPLINEVKGLFQFKSSLQTKYGKSYVGSAKGNDYVIMDVK